MPIYEYQCQDCGKIVEAMQRLSDAPLTSCADLCAGDGAGQGRLKKIMSATTVGRSVGPYGGMPMSTAPPMCGSCGMAPGSCGSD